MITVTASFSSILGSYWENGKDNGIYYNGVISGLHRLT